MGGDPKGSGVSERRPHLPVLTGGVMKDWLPAELEAKLVEWNLKCSKLGPEYAQAQGEVYSCDDRKNDVLADLTNKAEGESNAEKERNARLSPEWQVFRQSLIDAKAEALKKKIEYDVAIRTWETIRSIMSSKNAERRQS